MLTNAAKINFVSAREFRSRAFSWLEVATGLK